MEVVDPEDRVSCAKAHITSQMNILDNDLCTNNILALACDLQQCGILTCADSDEPVQLPFKLRLKMLLVSSLIFIE